ncbi:MAG: nicotinamide-nucleotide amidohydrolase family protein [Chitinispirillaceae bacterium]|nr:nicotinamide-nucleotide amidohydrolase family protein [Chitinispirillaceae bacterium]
MTADFFPDTTAVSLATEVGRLLIERKLSCATAESCTGGLIGAVITSVAGSSEYFRGGVIAYENGVKMRLLGVSERILAEQGAVSAETVAAMASGAMKLLGADCAVSVSGIAGPGGGTEEKPVGLVYIGTCITGTIDMFRHVFPGGRAAVRHAAAVAALQHLIDQLSAATSAPF